LTSGQNYTDADFGFAPPARIGDMVYWDANGNGQQDWGESGINGVVINLTNATTVTIGGVSYTPGAYVLTTTTTITGYYLFAGLTPTAYTVAVRTDTLPLCCRAHRRSRCDTALHDNDGCDPQHSTVIARPHSLTGGQAFLNADFGYQPRGVIGDFVFRDLDNDGLQDVGEQGIAGVVVTVTNGSTTLTTTTDFDGYYSFSNLADDTWTVTFATPPGMIATTVTNSAAATSGNGSVGTSASVVISSGSVTSINSVSCTACALNIDSGFRLNGLYSATGHIFFDSGPNGGIYSPTVDLPYSNIAVYLYDQNHNLVGSTTTDATGTYTFTNLPNGTFTVSYDPYAPKLTNMTHCARCDRCLFGRLPQLLYVYYQ
jgi:hypothetical protein